MRALRLTVILAIACFATGGAVYLALWHSADRPLLITDQGPSQ